MPQSSRMIVTPCARRCQRARSPPPRCWAGAAAARHRALLTSSSVDRNGRSRGKSEVNGVTRIYQYRAAGDQIQIRTGRHAGGDSSIEADGLVVDRDEPLVAARKRDRVRAVVPPVIDVAPGDDPAETHHLQDRGIAMLTDPLPGGGGLQARGTRDGGGPTIRVRRWAQRVL